MNTAKYAMLAVEDELGEALGKRMLRHVGVSVSRVLGLRGNGWLFKNGQKLNSASVYCPVVVLTDLDTHTRCPIDVVQKLCPDTRHANFVVRVCILEAESWVLADGREFAKLIGVKHEAVPVAPDDLNDAKEFLVRLAAKGKNRPVRADLVPAKGSTAKVGPAYNAALSNFVATSWDPLAAKKSSPSMAGALDAFVTLRQRLELPTTEPAR